MDTGREAPRTVIRAVMVASGALLVYVIAYTVFRWHHAADFIVGEDGGLCVNGSISAPRAIRVTSIPQESALFYVFIPAL
jgi:hypothetical protein